jgi:molybdopterin molybdotransferase
MVNPWQAASLAAEEMPMDAQPIEVKQSTPRIIPSYLAGRQCCGYGRGRGVVIHGVPEKGATSLCGKTYGRRSSGWSSAEGGIDCPACASKLAKPAASMEAPGAPKPTKPRDGAGLMPVDQAQALVSAAITPIREVERVALRDALGRVLASEIASPIDVPAHANSAMDGYAFDGALLQAWLASGAEAELHVAGLAFAGRAFEGVAGAGQCVRIMTGAGMPQGLDTVIPQELVREGPGESILFHPGCVARGDNVRAIGEDLRRGAPALAKGRILRPCDLGVLASVGLLEVAVVRRARVATFSTGDELRPAGGPLDPGCVYDSNRHALLGMLSQLGCQVVDLGLIRDDPGAIEAALVDACAQVDAVVATGGISVGVADFTKDAMARLGQVRFLKIAMRPGKPLAFGEISSGGRSCVLFGLPGNPVAAAVSFCFIARPALLRLMGADALPLPLMSAISAGPIAKKAGRTEYQRGILRLGVDGRRQVELTGPQGSGMLSSMSKADCMVVLGHDRIDVAAGEPVDVVVFDGLF